MMSSRLTDSGSEDIASSPFTDYLLHGVLHISSGFDHVVFLVALLLVCRRGREIIWAVTGFTLGHSISLTLAVFGMAQPNAPAIEAAIGLTIALVAVERAANSMKTAIPLALICSAMLLIMVPVLSVTGANPQPALLVGLAAFTYCYLLLAHDLDGRGSFRLMITALFGLIHGFGFAGAFLASGVEAGLLFKSLAGFNIGVELGQLALVAAMLGIGLAIKRLPRFAAPATELTAAAVCGLGVFWFVERLY